jgi:hypothetical protein
MRDKGDGAVPAFERFQLHLFQAAEKVSVSPNINGLPGSDTLQKLLNMGAGLAMLACVAAFLVGAGQLGIGSRSQNYSQAADGKEKMWKSALGAFAVGAVGAIITFFYQSGTTVH